MQSSYTWHLMCIQLLHYKTCDLDSPCAWIQDSFMWSPHATPQQTKIKTRHQPPNSKHHPLILKAPTHHHTTQHALLSQPLTPHFDPASIQTAHQHSKPVPRVKSTRYPDSKHPASLCNISPPIQIQKASALRATLNQLERSTTASILRK